MKSTFTFNSKTHDFWEIYNSIKKYYPIGLEQQEGLGIYYKYQGLNELEKLVIDNVHNDKKWKTRWVNFTKGIGLEMNMDVEGTTYGQAPSFSSSIILKQINSETITETKELHFAVSFIGKFYQIYGLDFKQNNKQNGKSSVEVIITSSPYEEFEEPFNFVEKKIMERYPEHRIVPYSIGKSIIKGLQVRYLNDEDCSISKALFNQRLDEENILTLSRGNENYGFDSWKI